MALLYQGTRWNETLREGTGRDTGWDGKECQGTVRDESPRKHTGSCATVRDERRREIEREQVQEEEHRVGGGGDIKGPEGKMKVHVDQDGGTHRKRKRGGVILKRSRLEGAAT